MKEKILFVVIAIALLVLGFLVALKVF